MDSPSRQIPNKSLPKNPLLSLCMIVKNEAATLQKALNSIKMLVDEIVIVDTGSTDNTTEIAAQYTDKIIHYKWTDNFAVARNISLSHATGEWILCLDADELIAEIDHHKIKELCKQKCDAFVLIQRTYTTNPLTPYLIPNDHSFAEAQGYSGYKENPIIRLFRNTKGVTFSGIIHESVLSSLEKMNLTIKDTTIPIHHFPESKKSEIKKKLYKKLGDIKLKTSDKKSSYEKAKRLLKEKNYKEAVPLLLSSLNDSTPSAYADCIYTYGKLQQPDKAREIFRKINGKNIFAYVQMGVVELNSGELQKALSLFTQVYTQDKRNVQAVVGLASVYYQLGNLKDSFVYIQKAIALVPNHPYAFELLAKINLHNKDIIHARKYFEISLKVLPENGEAWFNLGQIAVLQRDIKYALICFDNAMQHGDEKLKTMTRKRKEKIQQI